MVEAHEHIDLAGGPGAVDQVAVAMSARPVGWAWVAGAALLSSLSLWWVLAGMGGR